MLDDNNLPDNFTEINENQEESMSEDLTPEQIKKMVEENKKKKKTISLLEYYKVYAAILNDEPITQFRDYPFPKKFHILRYGAADKLPTVLEEVDGVCRTASYYTVSEDLLKYLQRYAIGKNNKFLKDIHFIQKAVQHWLAGKEPLNEKPLTIAFKSDPRLAYHRLPFDPIRDGSADFEKDAPTWSELLTRMSDHWAFMLRIGSLFDEGADRKQAVYISGPKDSGKSQIMIILGHLSGVDTDGGGAYTTLSNEDLDCQFWRAKLVNKRVVCIGEASPKFLCTEAFKAITGDTWHNINEKNKPMYMARINAMLFFFSNDPPAIDSKPDLIERIMDIRIKPVDAPRDDLLGEGPYQAKLRAELPYFIGRCMDLYDLQRGKRINCNNKYLQETIDEKESESIDLFEGRFIVCEPGSNGSTSYVYKTSVLSYLRDNHNKSDKAVASILHCWKRRYGMKSTTVRAYDDKGNFVKHINVWKGIREKFPHELTYNEEKEIQV
jgi:hypothetical protein